MTAGALMWHGKEIPAIIPGLSFDAEGHIYKYNGRQLKSVTQYTGPLGNHDFVQQVDLDFGSAVHDYLHKLDLGILAPGGDERMLPYIEGWTKFKASRGFDSSLMLAEYPLVSQKYLFTGRMDRMFDVGNYDVLLDIKTGQPSKITGIQLAAYGQAAIENGLTMASRLKLLEVCISSDGKCRPQLYDFKKSLNYFLGWYSLQNYLNS